MWKITNEKNKEILNCFKEKLIVPIFKEIIEYKKVKNNYKSINEFIESTKNLSKKQENMYKVVFNRRKNKIKFHQHIEELTKKPLKYIESQYHYYKVQNKQLDLLNYNVVQQEIDEHLKAIFNDFYYDKFIKDSKIWSLINQSYEDYSREKFHINFYCENKLNVCPYCDIDTLNNIGNRKIEHFLPKSKFPFLSMHPYNLISTCDSCNTYEGKSINYYTPIKSPYNCQIGDKISFSINDIKREVSINKPQLDEINNYLKLLNLFDRYKNKTIYDSIENKASIIFSILLRLENVGDTINSMDFNNYLSIKKEPLTFATKSIYEDVEKYNEYKTHI